MEQRIIVNLGQGSWQYGFPAITVQLWSENSSVPMQFVGSLPAASGLGLLYERWQSYYRALNANLGLRKSQVEVSIEIEDDDITHVSSTEFEILCQKLKQQFNSWLSVNSFSTIERPLRTYLDAASQTQLIIETDDPSVRRFPWHLWDFLEDYHQVEIAIGTLQHRNNETISRQKKPQVRILSVLGDSTGIQVSKDRDLLQSLPDVNAVVLDEPSRAEFNSYLWDEKGWDILFFAGHSSSQKDDRSGQIKINATESLSIDQLKYGLQTAIKKGLQLAIFNSCDGMGLARELADLHIPYLIVMREPVPDQVAQTFLMNFLRAFAAGIPFHLAMREARERLQGMESQFPCASWLPVLCQNPGQGLLTWRQLTHPKTKEKATDLRKQLVAALSASAIASLLILVARASGALEAHELRAYDKFMMTSPKPVSTERVLVVEATQEDVNTYGFPIPDEILAQAIEIIGTYQPRVVGLDIFRNRPEPNQEVPFAPNENPLYDQFLSKQNLIATCSIVTDSPGVPPPPGLSDIQIGFSNVLPDPHDEVIRRQLLFMNSDSGDLCDTEFSLGTIVALHYLDKEGVQPETIDERMHLGDAVFTPLEANSGGYRGIDARGFQVMLNYAEFDQFAQRISLSEVLNRQVPNNDLTDYGVLVGVSDPISTDYLLTPESVRMRQRRPIPGVELQAYMLNAILSAALDGHRMIKVLPSGVNTVWIASWSVLGAGLAVFARRASLWSLTLGGTVLGLYGLCLGVFILGWWIPWIPAVASLVTSSAGLCVYQKIR